MPNAGFSRTEDRELRRGLGCRTDKSRAGKPGARKVFSDPDFRSGGSCYNQA